MIYRIYLCVFSSHVNKKYVVCSKVGFFHGFFFFVPHMTLVFCWKDFSLPLVGLNSVGLTLLHTQGSGPDFSLSLVLLLGVRFSAINVGGYMISQADSYVSYYMKINGYCSDHVSSPNCLMECTVCFQTFFSNF